MDPAPGARGGRSVVSESSVLVSPLNYLVGYKPDGDLRFISRGEDDADAEAGRLKAQESKGYKGALRMVYDTATAAGRSVKTEPVPEADRRKFSISDSEVEQLARYAMIIEKHYQRPMDIEWGRDGVDGQLYILQARPETVKASEKVDTLRRYRLKERSEVLTSGRAIGQRVGSGPVRVVASAAEMDSVREGDVLVTDMTDPDWEPIMKKASAIVTNRGGRTCHAAIIARELGIPAVVGCGDATDRIQENQNVTVSCAEGDQGFVYDGSLKFRQEELALDKVPVTRTKIMLNMGDPAAALRWWRLPADGIGLARMARIAVGFGVHHHGLHAQFATGALDAQGNFAPVGNQDLFEHEAGPITRSRTAADRIQRLARLRPGSW